MEKKMNISEIEGRIRSKANCIEYFAIKEDLYLPNISCFNSDFVKSVLSGDKLLLKLTESTAPNIRRLKNDKTFDKESLFREVINNNSTKK